MAITESPRQHLARLLTEVGSPVVVLVAVPIAIAVRAATSLLAGLGWGSLAALFFGVIPFGYVIYGVRTGRWQDHHVGDRRKRKPVFLFSMASMLLGLLFLLALSAPRDLTAFLATLLAEAVLALALTLAWKVSLHAWVSAIGATALVIVYGAIAVPLWPLLAAVGWSRVELRDHTLAQVVAGTLLGALLTAAILPAVR